MQELLREPRELARQLVRRREHDRARVHRPPPISICGGERTPRAVLLGLLEVLEHRQEVRDGLPGAGLGREEVLVVPPQVAFVRVGVGVGVDADEVLERERLDGRRARVRPEHVEDGREEAGQERGGRECLRELLRRCGARRDVEFVAQRVDDFRFGQRR